jgi:hypothetical protein
MSVRLRPLLTVVPGRLKGQRFFFFVLSAVRLAAAGRQRPAARSRSCARQFGCAVKGCPEHDDMASVAIARAA